MKERISKIVSLNLSVPAVNRATIRAEGQVPTSGWTDGELSNDRLENDIMHFDFIAQRPTGRVSQVVTQIPTSRTMLLSPQPQKVTVHSETNDMSVTLPASGDPA